MSHAARRQNSHMHPQHFIKNILCSTILIVIIEIASSDRNDTQTVLEQNGDATNMKIILTRPARLLDQGIEKQ